MTQKTILISALDNYGAYPFDHIFDVVFPAYKGKDVVVVHELAKETNAKVATVIWGGADISPSIYNQKPNSYCGADEKLSSRDELEVDIAKESMRLGIPIIGICRGAQLMCCLSGGSLIQHVTGHAGGYHPIITKDGETYHCPSLHHQMMWPWGLIELKESPVPEHEVIAWMKAPRSRAYYGPPIKDETLGDSIAMLSLPGPEPEIVWFPRTKSLCIQSHPEFVQKIEDPFVQYTLQLTKHYILETT